MIDLQAASQLLDFGRRIGGGRRADEQLAGAVAIHNLLLEHRVAYLADEVGMGKTYVALGALALFRHFRPDFRVCVIAPRENIQRKWQNELTNFAAHNLRFADLRVGSVDRRPARELVSCPNLLSFAHESAIDPHRDFFLRMSSFSLGLSDPASWRRLGDQLRQVLPWVPEDAFDLRNKDRFKDSVATAIGCTLPKFDLVIVDEAHNLKHGYGSHAARNRLLGRVFGRADDVDLQRFPGYGPRAERVLFLSATPLEETYEHLWNQLDIFGLGGGFDLLRRRDVDDPDAKKKVARTFLVRRVTEMRVHDRVYTKNQYRRHWLRGGVESHDEPIRVRDPRQRLIVALVQKKVAELLGSARFQHSFQIGMLASFESFLETARLKSDPERGPFDDAEQAEDAAEREGIDVHDLNRLAKNHRARFGTDLPHPKMDAIVDALASAWTSGEKALVFVRRVASVSELKRKLDDRYDAWLVSHLRERLPERLHEDFDQAVEGYRDAKRHAEAQRKRREAQSEKEDTKDHGGTDTFFAWFFRGDGPEGFFSGATLQERFSSVSGGFATFFARHYVAELLEVPPNEAFDVLGHETGLPADELREQLRRHASHYLSEAKTVESGPRFEAAQAAGLELLAERGSEPIRTRALVLLQERYRQGRRSGSRAETPDVSGALSQMTFFSEIDRPAWRELRNELWPRPDALAGVATDEEAWRSALRERELRAELLSATARLGHASIDLWLSVVHSRARLRTKHESQDEARDDGAPDARERRIHGFLQLLDEQRRTEGRPWGAFDELVALAGNFELVVDVNAPDAGKAKLSEFSRLAAGLLRRQQPTGGMSGQLNATLVRQFRMPGYPFVLVTTDLLQEGEDLHTFCSTVHHYGISWTPSAMEQRIGRIDRVRSATDRRLSSLTRAPRGDELLQVHFPHLEDTVEVLQVRRVLERMNAFLRLMHEGLTAPTTDDKRIHVREAMLAAPASATPLTERLHSAFPVRDELLRGSTTELAVLPEFAASIRARFARLKEQVVFGALEVSWDLAGREDASFGTARLEGGRAQPFTLLLRSVEGRPVVRCISPVGRVSPSTQAGSILDASKHVEGRLGVVSTKDPGSYDLTVEDDVELGEPATDVARVGLLLRRVLPGADQLERRLFDDERDEPLGVFARDLAKEGHRG